MLTDQESKNENQGQINFNRRSGRRNNFISAVVFDN